jgi:hypothetical protein
MNDKAAQTGGFLLGSWGEDQHLNAKPGKCRRWRTALRQCLVPLTRLAFSPMEITAAP